MWNFRSSKADICLSFVLVRQDLVFKSVKCRQQLQNTVSPNLILTRSQNSKMLMSEEESKAPGVFDGSPIVLECLKEPEGRKKVSYCNSLRSMLGRMPTERLRAGKEKAGESMRFYFSDQLYREFMAQQLS